MKKFWSILLTALALVGIMSSCTKEKEDKNDDVNSIATLSQSDLVDAFASAYAEWENTTTIPESVTVGSTTLTLPQYQYALCKVVSNLGAGTTGGDVDVLNYKAADHPDRDSYDAEEIAVSGGDESVVGIANSLIDKMAERGQVPNQTVFQRTSGAIAFSTNRATVTMLRTLAAYKSDGKLPATVSTSYLSAEATLKGFARQFVGYLDIWQNTVGTVSADGSHCTDNGTAWENVHFVPIPWSGGVYADGKDQYDPQYQPYHTITVAGQTYDAAQCFVVAAKGALDILTKEGSAVKQEQRNTPNHTLGGGKALSESIPTADAWATWGSYPWYEKSDELGAINISAENPCNASFIVRNAAWFLVRAEQLGHIGNFLGFNPTDPDNQLAEGNYRGYVSAMRMFLTLANFYKYILDNNISENVYEAVKDVSFTCDLYGVEAPDLEVSKTEYTIIADGGSQEIRFNAGKDWTASSDQAWLTVSPASGVAASGSVITVTAEVNTGAERIANVGLTAGSTTVTIVVTQSAAAVATIRDFAEQYVKLIDIWSANTTTINKVTGLNFSGSDYDAANNVENAHYVPDDTKSTILEQEYTTADMLELALRCYAILRGYDGNYTEKYGVGSTPKLDAPGTLASALPATHGSSWGSLPYNEGGYTRTDSTTVGNGGPLMLGDPADPDHALANTVKLDILDNWMERNMNWANNKDDQISNGSGYPRGPITNYYGMFSAKRGLITYARVFKYVLDNSLDNLAEVSEDQTFNSDLFGVDVAKSENTIADFAKQFVTYLDKWESNKGSVKPTGADYTQEGRIVPNDFTITFNGTTLSKAAMNDIAMQAFQALVAGGKTSDVAPEARTDVWAPNGWVEGQPSNDPYTCKLDGYEANQADYNLINTLSKTWVDRIASHSGDSKRVANFYNLTDNMKGYSGYCCAERFNLILARTFKYMLDNNITSDIPTALADVKIDATLL